MENKIFIKQSDRLERKIIKDILINGEGTQIDRVHTFIKNRIKTNDTYWGILIAIICILFTGVYVEKHEQQPNFDISRYKRELDSTYFYKMDSVINFNVKCTNDVLSHWKQDTILPKDLR